MIVGSAELVVTALTGGVEKQLQNIFKDAQKIAGSEGKKFGDAFADEFTKSLNTSIQKAFEDNRDWIGKEGKKQGELFGETFTEAFRAKFTAGIADVLSGIGGNADQIGEDLGKRIKDAAKKGAASGGKIEAGDIVEGGAAPSAGAPAAPSPVTLPAPDAAALQRAANALQKIQTDAAARQQKLADDLAKAEQVRSQRAADNAQKIADERDAVEQGIARLAQDAIKNAQKLANDKAAQDQRIAQEAAKSAQKIINANNEVQAKLARADLAADQARSLARRKFQDDQDRANIRAQRKRDEKRQAQQDADDRRAFVRARKAAEDAQDALDKAHDAALKEDRKRQAAAAKAASDAAEAQRKKEIADLEKFGREFLKLQIRISDDTRDKLSQASDNAALDVGPAYDAALRDAQKLADARVTISQIMNAQLSDAERKSLVKSAREAEAALKDRADKSARTAQEALDLAVANAAKLQEAVGKSSPTEVARANLGLISKRELAAAERAYQRLAAVAQQAGQAAADADRTAVQHKQELAEAIQDIRDAQTAVTDAIQQGGDVEYAIANRQLAIHEKLRAQRQAAASEATAEAARARSAGAGADVGAAKIRVDLFEEGRRAGRSFGRGLSSQFLREARQANEKFTQLFAVGNAVGAALSGAVGAVASLGTGFFALAAGASEAAGALVVIPSLIGAAVQAAGTLGLAFSGVGKAISAGLSAQAGGGGGGGGASAAQANAAADARKALARAYEDSARRMRDADRQVVDAEENLVEAQNDAKIAQEGLTGARERAIESLEDLGFSVEGAALSEERAVLRLQQASRDLAEVQSNPSATAEDIQEASLNYREAELSVRMNKDALEDLQEEQAKATVAGVEGSAEVVEAQNDIIDANNRVADAEEALQRAQEDRADAALQNSRAISDAQERIARSMAAVGGGAGGLDAFQQALNELSPQARDFVLYIISLKDEMKELRAAAGEEMFPKLTEGIQNVVENFFPALQNVLRETGSAIGDFALSITDVIASSGFIERFTLIAEDNVTTIRRFGDIIASVISGISGVLVAAGPLVDRFTSFLVERAGDFDRFATSGEGIAGMTQFFQRAGDAAAQLGRIFGNLWDSLMALGQAALPAGQMLLDSFERVTEEFATMNSGFLRQKELETFFTESSKNAMEVMGLLGDLAKLIAGMGDDPSLGKAAKTLRKEWVPSLETIIEAVSGTVDAFAELIVEVTNVLAAFADSDSIKTFFDVLSAIAGVIADLVRSPLGAILIGILGPFLAIAKALSIAQKTLGFFFKSAIGGAKAIGDLTGKATASDGVFRRYAAAIAITNAAMLENAAASKLAAGTLLTGPGAPAATSQIGKFSKSFIGLGAAARVAGVGIASAARGLLAMLGGPWGIALIAAIGLVGKFAAGQQAAKQRVEDLTNSLDEQTGAVTAETFTAFLGESADVMTDILNNAGIDIKAYYDVLQGGQPELATFERLVGASNLTVDEQRMLIAQATGDQERYHKEVGSAQAAFAAEKEASEAAAKAIEELNRQQLYATASTMDLEDQQAFLADSAGILDDRIRKLVDGYSELDDAAINTERTNQRVIEGQQELKDELKGGAEQWAKLTNAQQQGARDLDINTKAGRTARDAILEQIEALDKQMQAQLDSGVAAETARGQYQNGLQAIRDNAAELNFNKDIVDAYIASVQATPESKTTRFQAIIEEQALKAVFDSLDEASKLRAASYVASVDPGSAIDTFDVLNDIVNNVPDAVISPAVSEDAIQKGNERLRSMLVDDDGDPLTAPIVLEEDVESFKKLQKDIVKFSEKVGIPVSAEVLDTSITAAEGEIAGLKIDPDTGDPWAPEIMPQNVKDALATAEAELENLKRERIALMTPLALDQAIDDQRKKLDSLKVDQATGLPRVIDAKAQAEITKAEQDLATLERARKAKVTADVVVNEPKTVAGVPLYIAAPWLRFIGKPQASGGPIFGPGGPTDDRAGLFALSNGEFVLSAKSVQALGGMSAVTQLHRALRMGFKPPAMQDGGTVPASSRGTLVRLGEAGAAERVEPLDMHGLSAGDRAILDALKGMNQQGFAVNIGTIESPRPEASAKQVVSAMRAESFRLGQLT